MQLDSTAAVSLELKLHPISEYSKQVLNKHFENNVVSTNVNVLPTNNLVLIKLEPCFFFNSFEQILWITLENENKWSGDTYILRTQTKTEFHQNRPIDLVYSNVHIHPHIVVHNMTNILRQMDSQNGYILKAQSHIFSLSR